MTGTKSKTYPRLEAAEDMLRNGLGEEAAAQVIEHLRDEGDEPQGFVLLGEIASKAGAYVQAEQFLRRAIVLGAATYAVHRDLALVVLKQDRLEEALGAFTALQRHVDDLGLKATRAMILDRLGRTDEALAEHERVIAESRAEPQHWIAYGHSLRFAGRTDEAVAAYRRALSQAPDCGEAWWSLADVKSQGLADEDLAEMQRQLGLVAGSPEAAAIHMALGRGWNDRGDFARAMDDYREGNRIRAERANYDPDDLTREIDQFIHETGPGEFGPPAESDVPTPVFLVSLPRSGSTLLEQMLARHPDIEAVGELPYVRALMRASMEVHMRRRVLDVPEYVAQLGGEERSALGQEYLRRAAQHRRTDARYFIDKMPSNWTDIPFIRAILPQARFIEIRRDPMDCCFSNYTHHFGSALAASFDLVHQARACVDYTRLMDHLQHIAPGMVCTIRYEQLVETPESELRKALDHLGLEWTDELLRFHESGGSVRTPSTEQVRQPLNRSGIGRWKDYAEWLQPLRDTLGPLAHPQ